MQYSVNDSVYEWFRFVTVAAEIVNVTSEQVLSKDSPVTLECVVKANPLNVVDLITWYRVADPEVQVVGAKAEVGASTVTSRLFIAHASSRNAGLYRCVAYNGLGVKVNATINVIVRDRRTCLLLVTTTTATTIIIPNGQIISTKGRIAVLRGS